MCVLRRIYLRSAEMSVEYTHHDKVSGNLPILQGVHHNLQKRKNASKARMAGTTGG
jgi:hypothetical protein